MHILFICTGNTCRSPMAAHLARNLVHELGLPWTIESAGTHAMPHVPMAAHAVNAMIRRQIPITGHTSKPVTEDLLRDADYVFTMTGAHKEDLHRRFPQFRDKIFNLVSYVEQDGSQGSSKYGIVDPFGGSDEEYEACAVQLEGLIRRLIHKLHSTP